MGLRQLPRRKFLTEMRDTYANPWYWKEVVTAREAAMRYSVTRLHRVDAFEGLFAHSWTVLGRGRVIPCNHVCGRRENAVVKSSETSSRIVGWVGE